jgi:hypothetical protein
VAIPLVSFVSLQLIGGCVANNVCSHIAWHVSAGLYVNLLEQTNLIPEFKLPVDIVALEAPWGNFTSEGPIDQIDSGLR